MSLITTCAPVNGYNRHTRTSNHRNDQSRRHHAFYFTHSKGQHILKNPGIIKDMINKSGIKPTDIVLEIGPGTGNLTMQLLPKCSKVICVEVDPRMISELRKRVQSFSGGEYEQKLKIIHGDAIKCKFPFFNLCIANIPYQISSPLLFKLLAHRPHFRCSILMVQHEFAQRCVSRVGDYLWCRLSINCQLLSRVSYLKKVSKHNFRPPPKVESALLRIEPRRPPPPINFIEWDGMIRICFERRHRLLNKIFHNKNVIASLYRNYQTFCKLQKVLHKNQTKHAHRVMRMKMEMELDATQQHNGNGNDNSNSNHDNSNCVQLGSESDAESMAIQRFLNEDENCNHNQNNNSNHNNNSAKNNDQLLAGMNGNGNGNGIESPSMNVNYHCRELNLNEFKLMINQILDESGMRQKRSRHLDVTDFLQLLKLFNDRNIRFK